LTVLTDVTERSIYLLGWPDPDRVMEPDGVAGTLVVGSPSLVSTITLAGVDAEGGGAGSPATVATVTASGVASGVTLGTTQVNAFVELDGVVGSVEFGDTEAFTSMNPSGFDASGGGTGSPSTVATVAVTGLSSGVTFGDPGIVATVFVIPGPIDPSNDFGDTTILMKRLIFRPPTQTLGWGWYKRYEGVSLLKQDGVWSEVPWPTNEETQEASVYLGGGRDHAVSTALAAELIGEGYAVTEEY
jgi:hypothetical protein